MICLEAFLSVFLTKVVSWLMTSFSIFDDVTKTAFLSVSYTPATWPKQWLHELSSFHWGNPWYKFQVRNLCTSWHIRVVYTSCTLIMAHKMCTLERVNQKQLGYDVRNFLVIKTVFFAHQKLEKNKSSIKQEE